MLWMNSDLVANVKEDILLYLAQIYQNHPPEFIYYKTLYHIFEKFLGDTRKTDEDLGKTTLFDTDIWKALFDLNPAHRYGASKARFFGECGFRLDAWEVLCAALCEHGQQNNVSKDKETGFGPRYEVIGELTAPDGRHPRICTVWQVDRGQVAPRLITAYPLETSL